MLRKDDSMVKTVLFVDDEPKVLEGLHRMLRSMRREWRMGFVTSAMEALKVLDKEAVDVVVTDMRMPGMNGVEFLTQVMKRHPDIVRIILSGHSDREMIMKSVPVAHQYLAKPCDAEVLKSCVARACALRELLADPLLKKVVSRMGCLPSLPSLYAEITEELRSPDASIQRVGEIISKDVAMTAKILQLVNSAFFGLRRRVANPAQAVNFLGLETIKSLVFAVQIFSQFEGRKLHGFSLEALWDHSMTVAAFARMIAREEEAEPMVIEAAFMAGLLHDLGKLVWVINFGEAYMSVLAEAQQRRIPVQMIEREHFGTSHGEVGAYLMGLWGLPDNMVEAIAYHHSPGTLPSPGFSALTAVHAADILTHDLQKNSPVFIQQEVDSDYVEAAGVADRLPHWRKLCENSMAGEER